MRTASKRWMTWRIAGLIKRRRLRKLLLPRARSPSSRTCWTACTMRKGNLLGHNHALQEAWQKIWTEAPFEPLAPDSMLEWLDARDSVLDTIERSREANNQIGALQKEVSDARAAVIAELVALGEEVEGLKDQSLRVVLEAGSA